MHRNSSALLALAGLALLGLSACSDNTAPPNTGTGPTAQNTREVGYAAEDELDADVSSFTVDETYQPMGFASAAVSGPNALNTWPSCITADPASPVDADGDGIPDDVTLTFDCSITAGPFTLARTGMMRIEDLNQSNGFDLRQTLTDFAWQFTDSNGDRSFKAIRNGTRTRTGTFESAELALDMNIVRQRTGHPDATIHRMGTLIFTAAQGESLFVSRKLPNGTFDLEGSQTWQRGDQNFSFAVTTPALLEYDASCTLTRQRIKAGELDFTGQWGDKHGVLKLVFTACGTPPTRTFTETPAS
jgi:hypothetical protein